MKTMAAALLALALPAQAPMEPAKDLFMHSAQAPGIEIRFVDYHWQPALFEAMEKGGSSIPEAQRNWVVARVILDARPLTLGSSRLPVGNYGLVLWPNLDGTGMAVEMRRIDMREVYPDVNAIAPAPRGETLYKGPAKPNYYLLVGTAGHASIEHGMRHKQTFGELPPEGDLLDVFTTRFQEGLEDCERGGRVDPVELRDRMTGSRGKGGTLPLFFRQEAPRMVPLLIEESFSVKIPGTKVPLTGTVDTVIEDPLAFFLRALNCGGRRDGISHGPSSPAYG